MKTSQEGLFQFLWAVDQDGYELHEVVHDHPSEMLLRIGNRNIDLRDGLSGHDSPDIVIRRKGGPWREYRPAETDPGIARLFASLPETEEAVLGFAETYGLIGIEQLIRPFRRAADTWPEKERLRFVYWSIQHLRELFSLVDSNQRQEALELFNTHLSPPMTIKIGGGGPRKPNLEIVPLTLESFMHLQLVNEITGRTQYTRCEQCPKWFPYRPKKQFCSDKCRKAWHRQHKETTK